MTQSLRSDLVAVARGDQPPDVLIRGVTLLNVLTATYDTVDIGILADRVAFVLPAGSGREGRATLAAEGLFAVPGLVDGHVHNESSMVTPAQWAKELLKHGTTTVFTDPHEIGNVYGLRGIEYMLNASQDLPLRYYITAPSCVPAVPGLETAGAVITAAEMEELLSWPRVWAVAEAMDYMGLINQTGNITPIAGVAHRLGIGVEGHAPGVAGWMLQAYAAATGPRGSDHEAQFTEEIVEKVKAGMMVYAKSSTFSEDSTQIIAAMRQVGDTRMFGLCTDDIMPHHLLAKGHLDHGVRRLIQHGVPVVAAYQMATINVAQHYHLNGIGAVAPGWLADILILKDLETVTVEHVIAGGRQVVHSGQLAVDIPEPIPPLLENSMKMTELNREDFMTLGGASSGTVTFNGIEMKGIFTRVAPITVEVEAGRLVFPLPEGVSLAAIAPRHGQGRKPSLALVKGYELQRGALASTVSHDSHNLAIIGRSPEDMLAAARELARVGGGLTAALDGQILGTAPLPIAGLMSPLPVEQIAAQLEAYEACLPELGLPAAFPIHLLALALPVVPEVRLTDFGLVNVATQQLIPTLAE